TRRQLIVGLVELALVFLVPYFAFGDPRYPPSSLRSTLIWITVAGLTGLVIQLLVSRTRASRDRFAAVLNAATGTAIIGVDPTGVISLFNVGAERMLGYRAEDVVGKATPALIHDPEEIAARAEELGMPPGLEVLAARVRTGGEDTR